jgi:hypothetical protein
MPYKRRRTLIREAEQFGAVAVSHEEYNEYFYPPGSYKVETSITYDPGTSHYTKERLR